MSSRGKFLLLIVLSFAFLVLLFRADKPFWGHHDWNNAYFGNIARNYTRYGLLTTKLGQVIGSGPENTSRFSYHTHHPPLLPLLLGLSYMLFGISELSTRLIPIVFSLATLAVLYRYLSLELGRRTALLAMTLWIITPLFLYYGKLAVHEIPVLFFFILSLWRYRLWLVEKDRRSYLLLALSILFAGFSGWPGHYIALAINLYHLLLTRRINPRVLLLLSLPVLTFSLHLLHNYFLTGSALGGGLAQSFWFRSTMIDLSRFIGQELTYVFVYITKPLVLMSLLGLIVAHKASKLPLLSVLFLFGIFHPFLFQEAALRHDYLIYSVLPFFPISAAIGVKWLASRNRVIAISVVLGIVTLSYLQSHRFLATLLEGERYREAVMIGKYINSQTEVGEKVLLLIPSSVEYEGWHTTFYADRNLTVLRSTEDFKNSRPGSFDVLVTYADKNFSLKRL